MPREFGTKRILYLALPGLQGLLLSITKNQVPGTVLVPVATVPGTSTSTRIILYTVVKLQQYYCYTNTLSSYVLHSIVLKELYCCTTVEYSSTYFIHTLDPCGYSTYIQA